MKTITVTDEQYETIKELCHERQTQNNRCTRNPIWLVQTERSRVCNPDYADYKYTLHDEDGDLINPTDDFEEFKKQVKEYLSDGNDVDFEDDEKYGYFSFENTYDFDSLIEWIEEYIKIECNYRCLFVQTIENYYETTAYFLTDREAKRYLEYQSHNLTNPRIYVDYTGYANYGYLPKLMDVMLELKLEESE